MKYLVMKVACDDGYYEGGDIAFAFFSLTPGVCQEIARRCEQSNLLATSDPCFFCVEWWDASPVWIQHPTGWEKPWPSPRRAEELEDEGHVLVKSLGKAAGSMEGVRIECCRMSVDKDGVRWICYLKHSDVEFSTSSVPVEVFRG